MRFFLPDQLGSAVAVVEASGLVVHRRVFLPFGAIAEETASPSEATGQLFTDQAYQEGAGLYDFQARWYDPEAGRFLSVDPLVADPGDPQMWNGYSYVRNSPASFVDPSGELLNPPPIQTFATDFSIEGLRIPGLPPIPEIAQIGVNAAVAGANSAIAVNSHQPAASASPTTSAVSHGVRPDLGVSAEANDNGDLLLAESTVSGKTDKHGKSEKSLKALRDRLSGEKGKLKEINRTGTRAEKRRQRTLLKNLQRKIDKLKKGTEHHRGVNPKLKGTYPWFLFDFQIEQLERMLGPEFHDTAMRAARHTES